MGQVVEAERLAAEVLKANRTDVGAASILARALMIQNRNEEAIAPLERAVRRVEDPGLETLLGAALGGAGRGSEAIDVLRRTTARRPPYQPAFQALAGQLHSAGRIDEAVAVIESALALAPGASSFSSCWRSCCPSAMSAAGRARFWRSCALRCRDIRMFWPRSRVCCCSMANMLPQRISTAR
ncbi:tetratricopeptide repeat protein [Bradyrhizobium sp. 13971]